MRVTFQVLFTSEFSFRSLWKSRSAQRKDNLVCPRFAAAHGNGPGERAKNDVLVLTVECHGERNLDGRSGDTRKRCCFARTAADRIRGTLASTAALLVLLAAAARTRVIALDRCHTSFSGVFAGTQKRGLSSRPSTLSLAPANPKNHYRCARGCSADEESRCPI